MDHTITSDCPYFGINAQGEATITIKRMVDGEQVPYVVVNLGPALDAAETIACLYIDHAVNTRMGTSEARQERKRKMVRKALADARS